MSSAHGLVDQGGDNGLPVHHGSATKVGGALIGVSGHSRCGARKLPARGDNSKPHRGLHRSEQQQGEAGGDEPRWWQLPYMNNLLGA
jgi:hypothetical protein